MTDAGAEGVDLPDIKLSVGQTFGIDCDLEVPAFSQRTEHVPEIDTSASDRRAMWAAKKGNGS